MEHLSLQRALASTPEAPHYPRLLHDRWRLIHGRIIALVYGHPQSDCHRGPKAVLDNQGVKVGSRKGSKSGAC